MKSTLTFALLLSAVLTLFLSQRCVAQDEIQSYTKVGQKMPAFTVTDTDGKIISIPDLKGKIALVNFWATWFGP